LVFMTPLSSGGYIHALTHVNMVPRTHHESKAGESAEGPNPKKKHLLHRLMKKVLIHSRQTIEIRYMLPNTRRFADCNLRLPKCAGLLTARWIRRSGPGSSIPPRMPTAAPLWRPTANSWSRSPWGPRVPFITATKEFRTDEKAAGTNAPAAVVTPSLAPGGRGLLLAQGQDL